MAGRAAYMLKRLLSWLVGPGIVLWLLYSQFAPFPYRGTVFAAARKNRVSPYLVAAVIRVESHFRPDALSKRGAVGLMQLMPATAVWILQHQRKPVPTNLARSLKGPTFNIGLGTWYLAYLAARFQREPVLVLAAYNAGPETVTRWLGSKRLSLQHPALAQIPFSETRYFVSQVEVYSGVYRWLYRWMQP